MHRATCAFLSSAYSWFYVGSDQTGYSLFRAFTMGRFNDELSRFVGLSSRFGTRKFRVESPVKNVGGKYFICICLQNYVSTCRRPAFVMSLNCAIGRIVQSFVFSGIFETDRPFGSFLSRLPRPETPVSYAFIGLFTTKPTRGASTLLYVRTYFFQCNFL